MTDAPAPQGHNNPPAGDNFVLQLEELNQDLWRQLGDWEMRRLRLPKDVKTEEQAAENTAHAAEGRRLMKAFEERRKEVKEPYLTRGQVIDDTFNGQKRKVAQKVDDIEARNGPYLRAKREREEAERLERAKIAREREAETERVAEEARQRERDAAAERERIEREAREAEARRVREEEQRRQQAALDAQQTASETQRPVGIDLEAAGQTATMAADNEAAMRNAHQKELAATKEREAAEAAARKAGVAAGRAEKKAEQVDDLGKVSAGGANMKSTMVWVGRVDSWPKVLQSLGPLAPFLHEQVVRDAVSRAARHPTRPEVPGVTFTQELEVKTTATRS